MSQAKRQMMLLGVMLAMGAIAVVWQVNWMRQQREQARYAAEDLFACQKIAESIASLREQPAVASEKDMGVQALGRRIETASRQAHLSGSFLEGVFPQSPRRLGDTPYVTKPTELRLRGVAFRPLLIFLYHLTDESGLDVRAIRLSSPRGDAADDVWDTEVTLSYMIYSPSSRTDRDY